jgi:hypothetical protein
LHLLCYRYFRDFIIHYFSDIIPGLSRHP